MNMIDHETMQIKVRIAFLRNPEISVEQNLMPKNIMNISMYLMIFNSIRNKKFQESAHSIVLIVILVMMATITYFFLLS